jgi:hypothetical protein
MSTQKLSVLSTVVLSYRIFIENLGLYARLVWFPFLATIAFSSLNFFVEKEVKSSIWNWELALLQAPAALIVSLCIIPAVVAWHRLIVLEQSERKMHFRVMLNKEEWGYVIEGIALFFILGIIFSIISGGGRAIFAPIVELGTVDHPSSAGIILHLVSLAVAGLPISGFLLILPSVAVGRRLSYREAKRVWSGNLVQIWAIYILALAPERIISILLGKAEKYMGTFEIGGFISGYDLLDILNEFIFFTISIGVLSIAYRSLVEKQGAPHKMQTQYQAGQNLH